MDRETFLSILKRNDCIVLLDVYTVEICKLVEKKKSISFTDVHLRTYYEISNDYFQQLQDFTEIYKLLLRKGIL